MAGNQGYVTYGSLDRHSDALILVSIAVNTHRTDDYVKTNHEPCLVLSSSLRSFLYHLDTSQATIVSITISDKVDSLLSQHEPNTYQSRSTINYSHHTKQHTLIKQLTQSTKD